MCPEKQMPQKKEAMTMQKNKSLDIQHLYTLFHVFQGEDLLDFLLGKGEKVGDCRGMREDCYANSVLSFQKNYSHSELYEMCQDLRQQIQGQNPSCVPASTSDVFGYLAKIGSTMLTQEGNSVACRFEQTLPFRQLSLFLGQDPLTTSFLAREDTNTGFIREDFYWKGAISTNNKRLNALMSKGISENHFHLNGSVPVFFLSWICLMNQPQKCSSLFQNHYAKTQLQQQLSPQTSYATGRKSLTLEEKVILCIYIRGNLFQKLISSWGHTLSYVDFQDFYHSYSKTSQVSQLVDILSLCYGQPLQTADGKWEVLDYAISQKGISSKLKINHHNRAYFGERYFLYHCFQQIFCGAFSLLEKNLFYLYLLFQNDFYSELVQVNGNTGFENFLKYQNRKDMFFESIPKYKREAERFALYSTQKDQNIQALEARITFKNTPKEQLQAIEDLDRGFYFAQTGKAFSQFPSNHFYVLHFIKGASPLNQAYHPRNYKERKRAEIQSKSLLQALLRYPQLRSRILGIDACSQEIGCRPETFATEFRFLRQNSKNLPTHPFSPIQKASAKLHVTYHAGEDFLDLIDGLRAIDETLLFLELERGDRFGHALALGLNPADYYEKKRFLSILPKQDILDNFVWILFRATEFSIQIPSVLYQKLNGKAEELLTELYGDTAPHRHNVNLLNLYYKSWKLRGHHPSLLAFADTSTEIENRIQEINTLTLDQYQKNKWQKNEEFTALRKELQVIRFYQQYHYDKNTKVRGMEKERLSVEEDLVPLLHQIQDKIQGQLQEKGIGIECNPSSNVLISNFDHYEKHPLFRFHPHDFSNPQSVAVSINTDDLGVFGTSLENEYALLAHALIPSSGEERMYEYLNHLRELGNSQSFWG